MWQVKWPAYGPRFDFKDCGLFAPKPPDITPNTPEMYNACLWCILTIFGSKSSNRVEGRQRQQNAGDCGVHESGGTWPELSMQWHEAQMEAESRPSLSNSFLSIWIQLSLGLAALRVLFTWANMLPFCLSQTALDQESTRVHRGVPL